MKKIVKILFILIISIMFIPFVNAKDIPKEGVTYFLEYPDGSENVADTYNEAINVKEKLIFEGYTNNDGKIVLNGWNKKGKIRIVQFVPDGYTTNIKEINLDLASASIASFIDYNGILNFKVGRNALIFFSLVVIIGSGIALSRKKKKALMLIPIAVIALSCYSVKAWNNSFAITVEDETGNPLRNTKVQIYGEPTIEASPAIKFSANGGTFFDGQTEMYYKIPYDGCTYEDFLDSLTDDDYYYLYDNLEYAYLNGYTRVFPDTNIELRNGTVIDLEWVSNSEKQLIKVDGNGGVYKFYNSWLPEITFYKDMNMINRIKEFKRVGYHYIGTDINKACTNYNEYGLHKNNTNTNNSNTIYLCWNKKPDGIYLNGSILLGNIDTCFKESKASFNDNTLELAKGNHRLKFILRDDEKVDLHYSLANNESERTLDIDTPSEEIVIVRIVYHGEVILTLTEKELQANDIYTIKENSKSRTLYQYLDELRYNSCF